MSELTVLSLPLPDEWPLARASEERRQNVLATNCNCKLLTYREFLPLTIACTSSMALLLEPVCKV